MAKNTLWKKTFVDYKNQLLFIFPVILINLFVFLCIAGILFFFSIRLSRQTEIAERDLNASIETETNIVRAFLIYSETIINNTYELSTKKIQNDHDASIVKIKEQVSTLRGFIIYYRYLFIAILIIQILQTLFLFRHMLILSHRISGPERVITDMIKHIASGKMFIPRQLHKKDKFQSVYTATVSLAEKKGLIKNVKEPKKRKREIAPQ